MTEIEKLCMGCMNELDTDDGEFCEIWKADPKSTELADVIEDVPRIVETQVIQYGRNKHFIVLADN